MKAQGSIIVVVNGLPVIGLVTGAVLLACRAGS